MGVQHDDVPVAEVEAVVALAARARPVAEVVERAVRIAHRVLVVAEHGVGVGCEASPARSVAVLIVGEGTVGERVVAQGHHGARERVEDLRCRLVAGDRAARDVARRDQGELVDGGGRRRGRALRPPLVRHGERHGVGAPVGVGVRRGDARAGAAVAEAPGVGQGVSVGIRRAAAVEAHRVRTGVRSSNRRRGRAVVRGDLHGDLVRARRAVLVRHRHPHGLRPARGVGVRCREVTSLAGAAAGRLGAVAPGDGVGPRAVVRARIAEAGGERESHARSGLLVATRVHRRRGVRDRRRGRHRRAGRAARVGDGERHGVAAVVGVGVGRLRTDPAGPVAEAPGVGQGVPVRVRRAASVERHGRALGAGVWSARRRRRQAIVARGGRVARAAARYVGSTTPAGVWGAKRS